MQLHELSLEASPQGSGTRAGGVLFVLDAKAWLAGLCERRACNWWRSLATRAGGWFGLAPALMPILGVKAGHLSDPS